MADTRQAPLATASAIAGKFVAARLASAPLAAYPGPIPADLDEAYACQDAAIALWPDTVAGWKVGWIPADWQRRVGEERLVGPIFSASVVTLAADEIVDLPVIDGGFSAVEAEFVVRIGRDAPPAKTQWSAEEAAAYVGALHIGVELAGSPLATINELGPCVVVSDFGNNAGLIVGPGISGPLEREIRTLTCETLIEGRLVGSGGAASLHGGPLAALAFALGRCARRGLPLHAGDLVTTGAASGIHDIRAGQSAVVRFAGLGEIRCRAVRATPRLPATGSGTARC